MKKLELFPAGVTSKEFEEHQVLLEVAKGHLTQKEAATKLSVTDRTIRRKLILVENEGISGLVHKGTGKPSNHQLNPALKSTILQLAADKYKDCGPKLFKDFWMRKKAS